jgi:hypothetical protein
VNSASPVARPGIDLVPATVLKDLEGWREAIHTADAEGSAPKLRTACVVLQKQIVKHTASCLKQIEYESLSLASLVSDLEKLV